MDVLGAIRDLLQHMEWADATVWGAVHKLAVSDDERLRMLLEHLHATQHAFMVAWTGAKFDGASFSKNRDLRATEEWARDYYRQLNAFVETLNAQSFDGILRLPWADGYAPSAHPTTLGETLLQVTSHSTYHRGQANMRIRELGGEPPLVDYIAWLWMGRPEPDWR